MTAQPTELGIVALVTHARAVPSEVRERFAAAATVLTGDPRAILVRTCHRAELYAATHPLDGHADGPPLELPPLPAGGQRLEDRAAARHLVEVAAGLDSVVIGEDQILHQLRSCLAGRPTAGVAGGAAFDPRLGRLFQIALRVGRETRSWREGVPRSLADVGLDEIERLGGPLSGRAVTVVGAGRMARLAALAAARRGARVVVVDRSLDRAAALAAAVGGSAVARTGDGPLPACDALVVAISARLELDALATSRLLDSACPLVDLSSPPALPAPVRAALRPRPVSIDDLARGAQEQLNPGVRARITRLLDAAEEEFAAWARGRSSVPAIQALSERAESQRRSELERLFRRLPLDEDERALVDQMSHRLVAGLLHAPLATLREGRDEVVEQAARRLFAL
ncbi:MAG TPA: NAD(P)-binding domain-containing protein [Candidatus Limnocylindrales bacterium]|nr:NAD(P)-binding domain-containing protein [Candidatus Limnocylindrales bacterium]